METKVGKIDKLDKSIWASMRRSSRRHRSLACPSRINPNVLTFMGLVVKYIAAVLFGSANAENQARMFRYAGFVIIGSGFFDLVDGRVARATNRVTHFGGFFDSVIDRYSDASQFLGSACFLCPMMTGSFTWY